MHCLQHEWQVPKGDEKGVLDAISKRYELAIDLDEGFKYISSTTLFS